MNPFWKQPDFWINLVVGVAGLWFAILAFLEARDAKKAAIDAKRAAIEAGRTVKIQTVTVELVEIAQKFERIRPDILFSDARDLLAESSRRLRRQTSPFANDPDFRDAVIAARSALDAASLSLKEVRPGDSSKEEKTPKSVYYGVESEFATISSCVADLIGLFEAKGFQAGDTHVQS
jgi:hypothetical protein